MVCPRNTYEHLTTRFKLTLLPCAEIHQYLPACHGFVLVVIGHLSSHMKYRDIHRASALQVHTPTQDTKDIRLTVLALRQDNTWVHVEIAANDLVRCKWQCSVPIDNPTGTYRRLMVFMNGYCLFATYNNESVTVLSESIVSFACINHCHPTSCNA
jgi:hypothetical protein